MTTAVEWLSDYLVAGSSGRKDPAICLEVAYRRAWQVAQISDDWSDGALRAQLTKWPIPGAYDDPDDGRLAPVYYLWRLRLAPDELRNRMNGRGRHAAPDPDPV